MRNLLASIGNWIIKVIDYFYPLVQKYVSRQFFRYGVTGASNLVFDWVVYFVVYNFVLQHRMLDLYFFTLSSHIASFAIKFPITLLSGFLLQKYVTFSSSGLRGRIQLFRYFVVVGINLFINYLGLKLFVDVLHFYPSVANMVVSILTIFISYFMQKRYTFQ